MSRFPRDMRGHADEPQIGDEPGSVISFACPKRQPPDQSGGMVVDHVQRGMPFGTAVGPGHLVLAVSNHYAGSTISQWFRDVVQCQSFFLVLRDHIFRHPPASRSGQKYWDVAAP